MGDFIESLREDRRKLVMVVVGLLVVVGLGIVGFMALTGGDDEPEIVYTFDDPPPGPSVEEQVALTVEASKPTATPEPTPDIPQTIAFASEQTRVARESDNPLQVGDVPQGAVRSLSAADARYLNDLGSPVWLSVKVHLRLSEMFKGLPSDVLNQDNAHELRGIRDDVDRAQTLMENMEFQAREVTPDVRDYGRYVDNLVRLARDTYRDADLMFSKVDLDSEEYDALSDSARREVRQIKFGIDEKLDKFERDIQRFGCSACGELYRGREESTY